MFDIGWQELFLVAILALIVVGPKELPRLMRTVMRGVRKAREMARDLQSGLDEVAREAELDDLKKDLESTGDVAKQIESSVDPTGDFDRDVQKQLSDAADELKESTDPDKQPKPAKPAGDAGGSPPPTTGPAKASG